MHSRCRLYLVAALLLAGGCNTLPGRVVILPPGPIPPPSGEPAPPPDASPPPRDVSTPPAPPPTARPPSPDRIGPSLAELDAMASALLQHDAARTPMRGTIVEDRTRSGGVAAIAYAGSDSTIYVHPDRRREWTTNTWAFIIGHELSHVLLRHRGTGPDEEWDADARGAQLATAAGYRVEAYIAFICSDQPNNCSPSHGCFHDRMRRLERQFDVTACDDDGVDHSRHAPPFGIGGLAAGLDQVDLPPSRCILEARP